MLVVDDDDAVRGVVRAALERAGLRVADAADGPTGLRTLASEPVDLVVLDWQLPGMSGLEVLESVVRDHPELPVVVCTGAGDAERHVALAAGAIDHITKARPLTELVRRVGAILAGDLDAIVRDDPAPPAPTGGAGTDGPLRAEVAAIAHELHNHLTVVLGHTDLVRTEVERSGGALTRSSQVLDDLHAVVAASDRIAALSARLRELAGPGHGPAPHAAGADRRPWPTGARILLVEDDTDLRVTTERLLRDEGHEMFAARDVASALELLRVAGSVDLCITDLLIPGAVPGEAAARLAEAAPATPVLVTSGYGPEEVESSAAPATAGFLAKPFTRQRLLDAIRSALDS